MESELCVLSEVVPLSHTCFYFYQGILPNIGLKLTHTHARALSGRAFAFIYVLIAGLCGFVVFICSTLFIFSLRLFCLQLAAHSIECIELTAKASIGPWVFSLSLTASKTLYFLGPCSLLDFLEVSSTNFQLLKHPTRENLIVLLLVGLIWFRWNCF